MYGLIATQKTVDCWKPNEEFYCKVLSFVKSNLPCSPHHIDKLDEDTQRDCQMPCHSVLKDRFSDTGSANFFTCTLISKNYSICLPNRCDMWLRTFVSTHKMKQKLRLWFMCTNLPPIMKVLPILNFKPEIRKPSTLRRHWVYGGESYHWSHYVTTVITAWITSFIHS